MKNSRCYRFLYLSIYDLVVARSVFRSLRLRTVLSIILTVALVTSTLVLVPSPSGASPRNPAQQAHRVVTEPPIPFYYSSSTQRTQFLTKFIAGGRNLLSLVIASLTSLELGAIHRRLKITA